MSTDVPIRILVVDDPDGAAELLGVKHTTLLSRMNKWGIKKRKLRLPELELMVAMQTFGCEN